MTTSAGVVAVFNTSYDITDMLRLFFEQHGYVAVSAFTNQIRDSDVDLESLIRQHQPQVIVYDIALPYEQNWRLYQHIRRSPACAGIEFVLTTTNVNQVKKVAGPDVDILELVGKPYDLNLLLGLVGNAMDRVKSRAG